MPKFNPDRFNPYDKPYLRDKPRPTFDLQLPVYETTTGGGDSIELGCISADRVYVEIVEEFGDHTVKLTFTKAEEHPNPDYEKQLAKWEKDHEKYKAELKEWNKQHKIYLAEQEAAAKAFRRKQFQQLKKEFEP